VRDKAGGWLNLREVRKGFAKNAKKIGYGICETALGWNCVNFSMINFARFL
jgi:hypothetical protein